MKKIHILAITALTLCSISFMGCKESISPSTPAKEAYQNGLVDYHMLEEISHGLHLIKINDSTQVLIYRGVESCSMIQLK